LGYHYNLLANSSTFYENNCHVEVHILVTNGLNIMCTVMWQYTLYSKSKKEKRKKKSPKSTQANNQEKQKGKSEEKETQI
jgi:hypothetical protein